MVSRVGIAALASLVACAHAEPTPPETLRKGAPAPAPAFVQASAKCAPAEPHLAVNVPAWRGQLLLAYVVHDDGSLTRIRIARCFPVAFGAPIANVSEPVRRGPVQPRPEKDVTFSVYTPLPE